MFNRYNILAIVSFLLIPVTIVFGVMLIYAIDPEIAARSADYERNYALLNQVRNLMLMVGLAACTGLWFLTCFFVLKARQRSNAWMLLAFLGPFGLAALTMLDDKDAAPADSYRQFIRKLNVYQRVAYELCLFVIVWLLAAQTMLIMRVVMIQYQSARTGMSVAQITEEHTASSGMYAFSEGLEVLFLVVVYYLLWPLCFNLVSRLAKRWRSARKDEPPLNGRA